MKSVTFDDLRIPDVIALLPLQSLRSLTHSSFFAPTPIPFDQLANIIEASPSLQMLEMTAYGGGPIRGNLNELIPALSGHKNLHTFKLTINADWDDPSFISRLFQVAKGFRVFGFRLKWSAEFNGATENGAEAYGSLLTSVEQIQDMGIQELSIELPRTYHYQSILILLLQSCPMLEKLEMFGFWADSILQRAAALLEGYRYQKLKYLWLPYRENNGFNGNADIIRALGYKSRGVNGIDDSHGRGLISFGSSGMLLFQPDCLWNLIEFHANTLTVLNLSSNCDGGIMPFVNVMTRLPSLRTLHIVVLLTLRRLGDPSSMKTVLQIPWSCRKLQSLKFRLSTIPNLTDFCQEDWNGSMADQVSGYLFSNLGTQECLQEWFFDCNSKLLTIEKGYLTRLLGLKQLRALEFPEYSIDIYLGEKEAEWIVENWPRLCQFNLRTRYHPCESLERFKSTMRLKRPWMEIN
ncbi:hypothetical protein BGZ76_009318 [Entomortierella beljakovae]|nr:hypothetical protein BGZ76_009318 [Entomortierella beljakovae]